MDHCPEVSTLSSFLDGELAEEENATLKVHLQKCAACRTRLQNMETGEELLVRDLRKPMTLDKYFSKETCISAEKLASYLHNLLSVEETTQVEGHLDLCDACLTAFTSLAKTEVRLGKLTLEPLPVSLRETVEAMWEKGEGVKGRVLHVAIRLAREGIEVVRESLFPQSVSFQELFATGVAYRNTLAKDSLPSGVLVKRNLPGMQLTFQVQQERENSVGLKVKIEDDKSNPLAGQRIFLRRGQILLYSERTDADGTVGISDVEPGEYNLSIIILGKESYIDLEIDKA